MQPSEQESQEEFEQAYQEPITEIFPEENRDFEENIVEPMETFEPIEETLSDANEEMQEFSKNTKKKWKSKKRKNKKQKKN